MKLKIKVKVLTNGCMPKLSEKGDAIDLRAAKDIIIAAPQAGTQYTKDNEKYRDVKTSFTIVPLGVAMELPKGFVADLKPRSSMFKKWHIIQTNTPGLIDSTYNGDDDEWGLTVAALNKSTIHKGDRLCQFEIRLSQNATFWQKLKWLFSSGIELIQVEDLNNKSRGGFGSTGIQ